MKQKGTWSVQIRGREKSTTYWYEGKLGHGLSTQTVVLYTSRRSLLTFVVVERPTGSKSEAGRTSSETWWLGSASVLESRPGLMPDPGH